MLSYLLKNLNLSWKESKDSLYFLLILLIALFEWSLPLFADFEEISQMLTLEELEDLNAVKEEEEALTNKKKGLNAR